MRCPVPLPSPSDDAEDVSGDALMGSEPDAEASPQASRLAGEEGLRAAIDRMERRLSKLDVLEFKLDQVLHGARGPMDHPTPRTSLSSGAELSSLPLRLGLARPRRSWGSFSNSTGPGLEFGACLDTMGSPDCSIREDFAAKVGQETASKRNGSIMENLPSKRTTRLQYEYEQRNTTRRFFQLWQFMEDEDSGFFARAYARAMSPFIVVSVCASLLQVLEEPAIIDAFPLHIAEATIEGIFLLEVFGRFLVMHSMRQFLLDPYNLIDILSTLPLALRACLGFRLFGDDGTCHLGCALLRGGVPLLRLIKLLRRFQTFRLLVRAFALSAEALPVLLFIWGVLGLGCAGLIFVFETRANVPTLSSAIWLSFVSMTTLGFTEAAPLSTLGRATVGFLVVSSALYMAIPLGIIGSAFSEVWKERDHILLTQHTRKRLRHAGYEAKDIPLLFHIFDSDRNESLNIEEFRQMVEFMKVGFRGHRVAQLFNLFDADGSGTIDAREFVKALFPDEYEDIYFDGQGPDGCEVLGSSASRESLCGVDVGQPADADEATA
mmetsp:Transcript_16431/g.47081  ORF Transcript_16431/g.47081 Transcript_16431/m.47081 type:complete len:549 (-) Transcript_16431:425-2071(-)